MLTALKSINKSSGHEIEGLPSFPVPTNPLLPPLRSPFPPPLGRLVWQKPHQAAFLEEHKKGARMLLLPLPDSIKSLGDVQKLSPALLLVALPVSLSGTEAPASPASARPAPASLFSCSPKRVFVGSPTPVSLSARQAPDTLASARLAFASRASRSSKRLLVEPHTPVPLSGS